jgi:hypothetical protein
VAYPAALKVINQKNEPETRDTILKALFFSPGDEVLEDILKDHHCGATMSFKVLKTPFFEESIRPEVVQNIRNVLLKMKATPSQGYIALRMGTGSPRIMGTRREFWRSVMLLQRPRSTRFQEILEVIEQFRISSPSMTSRSRGVPAITACPRKTKVPLN